MNETMCGLCNITAATVCTGCYQCQVDEIARLRAALAEPHSCDVDAEQRVIRLAAAIRAEHFRMDGTNVTMTTPQHEHERSIMLCQHPLCLALHHAKIP